MFGNGAEMTALANDGETLYVETIPLQWALDDVAGEATMHTWISLDPSVPNVARVHNELRNKRTDSVEQYQARHQELPAVYTNWPYVRVFTYTGDAPFSGAPVTEIDTAIDPGVTFPWKNWRSTEGWSALVDDSLSGVGVVHPGAVLTIGGRAGIDHPFPSNTGYLSPLHTEIIDHDITYSYDYTLVLGDLEEIRSYAEVRRVDPRPEYVFAHDRQHFAYSGATDAGVPTGGFLDVRATSLDPQIKGPAAHWDASEVPRLFVRAAFTTADDRAELFFADGSGHFDASRRLTFDVVGDGSVRTYEIDLAAHPEYSGSIGGIRLDPAVAPADGDRVELHWISHRDDPVEPEAPSTPPVPGEPECETSDTTTTAPPAPSATPVASTTSSTPATPSATPVQTRVTFAG